MYCHEARRTLVLAIVVHREVARARLAAEPGARTLGAFALAFLCRLSSIAAEPLPHRRLLLLSVFGISSPMAWLTAHSARRPFLGLLDPLAALFAATFLLLTASARHKLSALAAKVLDVPQVLSGDVGVLLSCKALAQQHHLLLGLLIAGLDIFSQGVQLVLKVRHTALAVILDKVVLVLPRFVIFTLNFGGVCVPSLICATFAVVLLLVPRLRLVQVRKLNSHRFAHRLRVVRVADAR
jgi:hypothetical protein